MNLSFQSLKNAKASDLVKDAEDIASQSLKNIKTHQIRNFYSSITKMKVDWRTGDLKHPQKLQNAMVLIKPKLAYAAARNKNLEGFYELIKTLIEIASNELEEVKTTFNTEETKKEAMKTLTSVYDNFIIFMEAIVAYHKYYGPK